MQSQIQIPEPCNVPWNSMQAVDGGRHCLQCSTVVRDFTAMTDEQILAHIRQAAGPMCGHVKQRGLKLVEKPRFTPFLLAFIVALAMVFGIGTNATAQQGNTNTRNSTFQLQMGNRESGCTIQGKIVRLPEYRNRPLDSLTVELENPATREIIRVRPNARGEFVFNNVAPGAYFIFVRGQGFNYNRPQEFEIDATTRSKYFELIEYEEVREGRMAYPD